MQTSISDTLRPKSNQANSHPSKPPELRPFNQQSNQANSHPSKPPELRPFNQQSNQANSHPSKPPECFYCHEVTHFIRDCPKLKRKNEFRFGKHDVAGLLESSPATVVEDSQLSNLLGDKNVTNVMVNSKACLALIDSGSEVSTIARSYVSDNDIQELDTQLMVHAAGGHIVTYLGVSEIDVHINPSVGDDCDKLTVLALNVPDSNVDSTVPLILGT